MGELPQLERQRDNGDLPAEAVDHLAEPEQPEVAVALYRIEVDEEAAQAAQVVATGFGHRPKG